jgi:hypothetical protein
VEGNLPTPSASIGDKSISASDKAEGTLYISIKLSDISQYHGSLDEKSIKAVKLALEQTHKISVFIGNYEIGTTGRRYGIGNLGGGYARTVYYFDKSLGGSCAAVQAIVAGVIGMPMSCVLTPGPPRDPDPNALNLQADFWSVSGLDMEVVL